MKWLLLICLLNWDSVVLGATYEEHAVAAVLMGEAWAEGSRGMTAVAEVIHQRAKEKGQAPLQVISAHAGKIHAFSCLNGTTVDQLIGKFSDEPTYRQALRLAETTCERPSQLPGLTNAANHFTRSNERPYWARGREPVAVIGRHAFYRLTHY